MLDTSQIDITNSSYSQYEHSQTNFPKCIKAGTFSKNMVQLMWKNIWECLSTEFVSMLKNCIALKKTS